MFTVLSFSFYPSLKGIHHLFAFFFHFLSVYLSFVCLSSLSLFLSLPLSAHSVLFEEPTGAVCCLVSFPVYFLFVYSHWADRCIKSLPYNFHYIGTRKFSFSFVIHIFTSLFLGINFTLTSLHLPLHLFITILKYRFHHSNSEW